MNPLYPNFLRRIDHYLKINYPHVWRTRVHDFGWFSLLLGNVIAATLGILIVGRNNVLSEGEVTKILFGFAVLLGFIGLFWAIRLLHFKMKFTDFKTLLTTWVIYVLCIVSLGVNLTTLISTIAYRTANLYSDEILQKDYNYLNYEIINIEKTIYSFKRDVYYYDGTEYHFDPFTEEKALTYNDSKAYLGAFLNKEYRTDELLDILLRHGYQYDTGEEIYRSHIDAVAERVSALHAAKVFVGDPFLSKKHRFADEVSFYHDLMSWSWLVGMLALFFLPALLFLVSAFGIQNVLISAFCTALITGSTVLLIKILSIDSRPDNVLFIIVAFAFVLGLILAAGKQRLQIWNYIAGTFMLILGGMFVLSFSVAVVVFELENIFLAISLISGFSLVVSLMVAWMISKRNCQPVLH